MNKRLILVLLIISILAENLNVYAAGLLDPDYSANYYLKLEYGRYVNGNYVWAKLYLYYDNIPNIGDIKFYDSGSWHTIESKNTKKSYYWFNSSNSYTQSYGYIKYDVAPIEYTLVKCDTNIPYENNGGIAINNYYITDEIGLLSEQDIYNFHTLEKEFEQNLEMQFFIRITDKSFTDENLKALYNEKLPSGKGGIVIVYNKSTKEYKLALSWEFLNHGYYNNPHNRYAYDFRMFTATMPFNIGVQKFLGKMYQNFIYGEFENINEPIVEYSHRHETYIDNDIATYSLRNEKLDKPDCWHKYIIFDIYEFKDKFGFNRFEGKAIFLNFDKEDGTDGEHIFTISTEYTAETPTPTATVTPVPSNATPTPTHTPINSIPPYTMLPEINLPPPDDEMKSVTKSVYGKLPFEPLKNSLDKLRQLNENSAAPVFKINLNQMTSGVCQNFDVGNPFPAGQEYTVFDLSVLDDFKFMGISIRVYLKGLISAWIIYLTVIALWKRIVPTDSIGG